MKNLLFVLFLLCTTTILSAQTCQELLQAVKQNNTIMVKQLLKKAKPNCSYRGDGEPRSPLGAAAYTGNIEIGRLLINAGARANYRAKGDASALMIAAEQSKPVEQENTDDDNEEEVVEVPVNIGSRAFPLVELLKAAIKDECEVMWEDGSGKRL